MNTPNYEQLRTDIAIFWQWLKEAPHKPRHPFRIPTFVTPGPNARSIVLRALDNESLIFFTDKRTPKVSELNKGRSLLHVYDTKRRTQYRVYGTARLLDTHEKMKQWRNQGLRRFSDYGSKHPPGAPMRENDNNNVTLSIAEENFSVIHFCVDTIEILKLTSPEHQRIQWYKDTSGWKVQPLYP